MTLQDRAKDFVETGHPRDEAQLLIDCMRARNVDGLAATQRLFEDMYGGITYNYEMKAPAAVSLICWGKEGIRALVEGARRTVSSKNTSITLQLLSTLAAGNVPALFATLVTPEILACLYPMLQDPDVRSFARQQLTEFMLSFPDDDDASAAAGSVFQHLAIAPASTNSPAIRELFGALATRWLAIGRPTLASYDDLIRKYPDEEPQFQAFFEKVPQFLDPFASAVWPKPDLHGAKEPDFVLKRADGTYLIVEIETPAKTLVTAGLQLSAQATQAITQAMQYRAFLLERFQEANTHFPEFRDPDCLVVLGLEHELTPEQHRALALENASRKEMRIVGFDWIADRAERILQNMISANIAVRPVRMI
jgi:hypothetical protein